MAGKSIWHAKSASIKIDASGDVTITGATALHTFFSGGTAIEGFMKDITITEPIADVDKIDLHGTDTDGFQNAALEEKTPGLVEVTGTMILPVDESGIHLEAYDAGTAVSGYTRYRAGKATIRTVALLLSLSTSTDGINYAGDNMVMTSSSVKSTGADGHFEQEVTFKCLPSDWYGPEFRD